MAINIGDKKLKNAYIGDRKIKAIYMGDKKIRGGSVDVIDVVQNNRIFFLDGSLSTIPSNPDGGWGYSMYRGAIFDPRDNNNNVITDLYAPSSCDEGGGRVLTYGPQGNQINKREWNRSSSNCFPQYGSYFESFYTDLSYTGGFGQYGTATYCMFDKDLNIKTIKYFSNGSSRYDKAKCIVLGFRGERVYYAVLDNTSRSYEQAVLITKYNPVTNSQVDIRRKLHGDLSGGIHKGGTKTHYYDNNKVRIKYYGTYNAGRGNIDIDLNNETVTITKLDNVNFGIDGYYGSFGSETCLMNFERIGSGINKGKLLFDGKIYNYDRYRKRLRDNARKEVCYQLN